MYSRQINGQGDETSKWKAKCYVPSKWEVKGYVALGYNKNFATGESNKY